MRATTITYVNPAVAVMAGVVVLDEPVTVWTVVGFVLVVAGSYPGQPPSAAAPRCRLTGRAGGRGRPLRRRVACRLPETSLTIARRFCGPPDSGNGGYTAGLFAGLVADRPAEPVTVTLRQPPPLERPLVVEPRDGSTALLDGDLLVADAVPGELRHDPVAPVGVERAREVEATYAGLDDHSFDGCFVCGPGRAPGDGLRLFPGLVGDGLTACVWTPHRSLEATGAPGVAAVEFVWSALDCPGGWTSDLVARPLVLGRMTGTVVRLPATGRPVVVVGERYEQNGRKTLTATTAYDDRGRVVGRAEQVWIEVDPSVFAPGGTR